MNAEDRQALQQAGLLEQSGRLSEAEDRYRELAVRRPEFATARFNYACFLRRQGRPEEALAEHRAALELKIDRPEEVLSNMGVILNELRRDADARAHFERALAANADYIPALYNLALLFEEFGERDQALGMFRRILDLDPHYYDALVRIVHAVRIEDPQSPLIGRLRRALRRAHLPALTRESLHFALGKAYDDAGRHDLAFEQYRLGNLGSAPRLQPYDRRAEEAQVAGILAAFTPAWLAGAEPVSDRPLVFITGQFRSGSTLIEQMLAGHPGIAAGGEIAYFDRALARTAQPLADAVRSMGRDGLRALGTGYVQYLDRNFPGAAIVTNKRPDTFAWLGLLKGLFPNARFVHTVREPRDTGLSIWFQQLDGRVAYANDLANIAHHWTLCRRLMGHWQGLFGEAIFDADYDAFVAEPRPVAQALLDFLGLDWREECLDFSLRPNRVRTASVWQVREPLYGRSSGRWRRYQPWLPAEFLALPARGMRA
ncbi:MAG: sulfotransferase [Steroidobacteraceae bacterium]|nr:sulfotransferase [Steroidobacteraceae bacterium]